MQQFKRLRRLSPFFVILVVIGALLACGNSADANPGSGATPAAKTATTASQTVLKVGQSTTVGDWQVTVNSIKTSPGGGFDQPKSGDVYLLIDVSVKNQTGKSQTFSSLISFTLKDTSGQKYDQTFVSTDTAPASPDGNVANGDTLKGTLPYEVPTSVTNVTLEFSPDLDASSAATWSLSVQQ